MKITLSLTRARSDDDRISEDILKDLDNHARLFIWRSSPEVMEDDEHYYSAWLEYGKDNDLTLMFELCADELELFATTVLKDIKMFRRDCKKDLQERTIKGYPI